MVCIVVCIHWFAWNIVLESYWKSTLLLLFEIIICSHVYWFVLSMLDNIGWGTTFEWWPSGVSWIFFNYWLSSTNCVSRFHCGVMTWSSQQWHSSIYESTIYWTQNCNVLMYYRSHSTLTKAYYALHERKACPKPILIVSFYELFTTNKLNSIT